MISGLSLVLNVTAYALGMTIAMASGFYTYRQRLTAFQLTRDFFFLIYIVVIALMLVDLARILTGNAGFLSVYPLLSFGLDFVEATLLLTAAVGGYLRPNGSSYRLFLEDVRAHPRHLLMFVLFIGGTVAAEVYATLFRPYVVFTAKDFAGGTVAAVTYSTSFSIVIGCLFFFFLAYPVGLFIAGARHVQNPQMKSAQFRLGIGFAVSSAVYLLSALALANYGIDTTAIAYLSLSAFFGILARNFRRAAVFAGFVSAVAKDDRQQRGSRQGEAWTTTSSIRRPMTSTIDGVLIALREGQLTLLEVDTSIKYEERLNDLVNDLRAEKRGVFVISAKGSRLYKFFSAVSGIKLYTMSESVRYIAPSTTRADEVNIPLFESGVLLEVLERTLGSSSSSTASNELPAIIFDSVSDMTIYSGFPSCYKFLREAVAITSGTKATILFILFAGAHDEKDVMTIRGLFASQLKLGPDGFKVVR